MLRNTAELASRFRTAARAPREGALEAVTATPSGCDHRSALTVPPLQGLGVFTISFPPQGVGLGWFVLAPSGRRDRQFISGLFLIPMSDRC